MSLSKHIGRKRTVQVTLLLLLTIVSSFAEVVSIGAVLPFLAVLATPQLVYDYHIVRPVIQFLGIGSSDQLLFPLTVVFCVASVAAGIMRWLLLWANTRLSFAIGSDISKNIYNRTIYQPYIVHLARNSSAVIDVVASKAFSVVSNTVSPVLALASSIILLLSILAALLWVDAMIALVTFGGFGLIYSLVMWATRRKSLENSQKIALGSTLLIKSLQEGLGGIREILIDGSQASFSRIFESVADPLYRAHGSNVIISSSPRIGVEMLGMLLIALVAYSVSQDSKVAAEVIPVLGTLALGAQRMLPLLQQAFGAVVAIRGGQVSLQDTLELLDQPLPVNANQLTPSPLLFNREIRLTGVAFRYGPQMPDVLDAVDLVIPKGSRYGFIGSTGSGKSTLLDIIMGLLRPTEGVLEIDGQPITAENCRAWQARISHVSQSIFLADSSIEENIAFGVPKALIDRERVRMAARQAQIAKTIETLPEQYQTHVGELGVRLSGGQRQRLGIARALYRQSNVIIFDEATSSLDNETEHAVMQAIKGLSEDLTVLIIAHRITTLKDCTQIFELSGGRIARKLSFQDITLHLSPAASSLGAKHGSFLQG